MNEAAEFLPRQLTTEIEDALACSRVVNLVGPRQVGKTTLVKKLFNAGKFITLDDEAILAAIESDPIGQIESLIADIDEGPLIIDEAQRSKKLALAIKRIVDNNRQMGQFILTGSSNVFTSAEVADSLAGTMRTVRLWPLSVSEVRGQKVCQLLDWATQVTPELSQINMIEPCSRDDYIDLILAGGYPEMRGLPLRGRHRLYRDYVDSVVDKDVADIFPIRKPDSLRRLIDQMAFRTAAEINIAELGKSLQLKRDTVDHYLDILLRLSIVTKLGSWTSGEAKREVKNAKFHFADSGISSALRRMNVNTFRVDENPTALGGLLESFAFGEIQRALPMQENDFRLYHWRIPQGREVDILADGGTSLVAIEVKASATVNSEDLNRLRWFAEQGPGRTRKVTSLVLYLGREKLTFGERCFALPLSSLWSQVDL